MPYATNGSRECGRHALRALAVALQKVEGNSLGGFLPDARHAPQCIDQLDQ
jgi:hypothetical protein